MAASGRARAASATSQSAARSAPASRPSCRLLELLSQAARVAAALAHSSLPAPRSGASVCAHLGRLGRLLTRWPAFVVLFASAEGARDTKWRVCALRPERPDRQLAARRANFTSARPAGWRSAAEPQANQSAAPIRRTRAGKNLNTTVTAPAPQLAPAGRPGASEAGQPASQPADRLACKSLGLSICLSLARCQCARAHTSGRACQRAGAPSGWLRASSGRAGEEVARCSSAMHRNSPAGSWALAAGMHLPADWAGRLAATAACARPSSRACTWRSAPSDRSTDWPADWRNSNAGLPRLPAGGRQVGRPQAGGRQH